MSLGHTWYFNISYQRCKLLLNASENVIWTKMTDKNLNLRDRNKNQSDLEKFKRLEESMYAKTWRKINSYGQCGIL